MFCCPNLLADNRTHTVVTVALQESLVGSNAVKAIFSSNDKVAAFIKAVRVKPVELDEDASDLVHNFFVRARQESQNYTT